MKTALCVLLTVALAAAAQAAPLRFTTTDLGEGGSGSNTLQTNVPNAIEGDAWRMSPGAIRGHLLDGRTGRHYVAVRAKAGEEYVSGHFTVTAAGQTVGSFWQDYEFRDVTGGSNLLWFSWSVGGPAYGYIVVGEFVVDHTGEWVMVENTSEYYLGHLDEVVIYSAGEGYSTKAQAEANPYLPVSMTGAVVGVVAGGQTPMLHVSGTTTAGNFDHVLYFENQGGTPVFFHSGDLDSAELLEVLEVARGTASVGYSFAFSSPHVIGGSRPQGQGTLEEVVFTECCYQVLAATKLPSYDEAALGAIWISTNRGPLVGSFYGDIAYRLYQELNEQAE